jgi:hypothetical protein
MPTASREFSLAGAVPVVTLASWIPAVLFSRAKIPQAIALNADLFFPVQTLFYFIISPLI